MKRNCLTAAALLTLLCSVGCCYRPGSINPYNGIAYGGRWEAMPGGPLDVTACYGPNFCPTYPMNNCWNVCEPPCPMPVNGSYMSHASPDCCDSGATSYPQTYMPGPQFAPHGHESVPGMQPVPDPNIHPAPMGPNSPKKSGGATTYVVPEHLPQYDGQSFRQANSHPWVQAY